MSAAGEVQVEESAAGQRKRPRNRKKNKNRHSSNTDSNDGTNEVFVAGMYNYIDVSHTVM